MSSRHLTKGDVRFVLLFEDKGLTVPIIQTLIYLRSECTGEVSGRHFFIDVSSEKHEEFFIDDDDFDDLILDINRLYEKIGQLL